jgi:hypothetical protein
MPKLVTPTKNTLTHDEKRLVEAFRGLTSPEAKRMLLATAENYCAALNERQPKPKLSLVGADDGGNHA